MGRSSSAGRLTPFGGVAVRLLNRRSRDPAARSVGRSRAQGRRDRHPLAEGGGPRRARRPAPGHVRPAAPRAALGGAPARRRQDRRARRGAPQAGRPDRRRVRGDEGARRRRGRDGAPGSVLRQGVIARSLVARALGWGRLPGRPLRRRHSARRPRDLRLRRLRRDGLRSPLPARDEPARGGGGAACGGGHPVRPQRGRRARGRGVRTRPGRRPHRLTCRTRAVTSTGADLLVRGLSDSGVPVVFGLPGVHNLAAWKALAGSGIRLVGVRHEQTAVYAADGYARATGSPGVAITTTGPGAANTLGACGEAWASGSPVVVIATDIPTTIRRPGVYRGSLHEATDQLAMFLPVTKDALRVGDASALGDAVRWALDTALAPPSRPVYLEIPTDLLSAAAEGPAAAPEPRPLPFPSDDELARAAAIVSEASRPLI